MSPSIEPFLWWLHQFIAWSNPFSYFVFPCRGFLAHYIPKHSMKLNSNAHKKIWRCFIILPPGSPLSATNLRKLLFRQVYSFKFPYTIWLYHSICMSMKFIFCFFRLLVSFCVLYFLARSHDCREDPSGKHLIIDKVVVQPVQESELGQINEHQICYSPAIQSIEMIVPLHWWLDLFSSPKKLKTDSIYGWSCLAFKSFACRCRI